MFRAGGPGQLEWLAALNSTTVCIPKLQTLRPATTFTVWIKWSFRNSKCTYWVLIESHEYSCLEITLKSPFVSYNFMSSQLHIFALIYENLSSVFSASFHMKYAKLCPLGHSGCHCQQQQKESAGLNTTTGMAPNTRHLNNTAVRELGWINHSYQWSVLSNAFKLMQ